MPEFGLSVNCYYRGKNCGTVRWVCSAGGSEF